MVKVNLAKLVSVPRNKRTVSENKFIFYAYLFLVTSIVAGFVGCEAETRRAQRATSSICASQSEDRPEVKIPCEMGNMAARELVDHKMDELRDQGSFSKNTRVRVTNIDGRIENSHWILVAREQVCEDLYGVHQFESFSQVEGISYYIEPGSKASQCLYGVALGGKRYSIPKLGVRAGDLHPNPMKRKADPVELTTRLLECSYYCRVAACDFLIQDYKDLGLLFDEKTLRQRCGGRTS